ncbi:unnamed protein product [Rotaria sordida]|uniref:F-box domain-containing protein n=1 Tax=Rotaria sordida TaxID=392033 RepID=A0A815HP15_9BILA|nr:unnamed protein product [Rotaria sordida]CAF1355071.1 unnamed protein product [Rotaria sordida]
MSTGKKDTINILDLPDEIVLAIIRKLNMINVLYSLVGVNQRFDRLVLDPLYVHHLDLTVTSLLNNNFSVGKKVLDRICEEILPRISNNIKKIILDQHSMERILPAIVFSQLYSLTLSTLQPDALLPYLTELTLYLSIRRIESTYIDGTHLYDEILIHMPQLKKFNFNIYTLVFNKDIKINLPSNNDIQQSFVKRGYQQIDSYTHKRSTINVSTCHIYSLPYQFDNFFNMNCHFPGGIFEKVQCVVMTDKEHPFERELFQIMSHSFPFLRQLAMCNYEPQKRKQHSSENDKDSSTISNTDKDKKVNRKQLGAFGNNSLMMKLLELKRSLYQIHKSSLNSSENDRFEQVFSTTLMCMKSVLRLTFLIGGILWTTGNILSIFVIRINDLGMSTLLWCTTNMLVGWASGHFGWFGLSPENVEKPILNYIGVIITCLSGIAFLGIRTIKQEEIIQNLEEEQQPILQSSPIVTTCNDATPIDTPTITISSSTNLYKCIIGCILAIIAGILFGFIFIPSTYIQDHPNIYQTASKNGLHYVFAMYSGIFFSSMFYYLIYIVCKVIISGIMWSIAQVGFLIANSVLSQTISFPLITIGPGTIAIFYFKEIFGRRNYLIIIIGTLLRIISAILIILSKPIPR